MITSLLVAIDLSGKPSFPVERAFQLMRQHACPLILLHVIDPATSSLLINRRLGEAHQALDSFLTALPAEDHDRVTTRIVLGTPHWEIGRQARHHRCDLIILGMHQHRGSRALLIGSTMEGLVREAGHPVLVVTVAPQGDYKKLMIGVDFSFFSRLALRKALAIAPGAGLTIIHAHDPASTEDLTEIGQRLRDFVLRELDMIYPVDEADAVARNIDIRLYPGEPRTILRAEIEAMRPDLLVIGTHGQPGLPHSRLGSLAIDFLKDPPCDVLAVKGW